MSNTPTESDIPDTELKVSFNEADSGDIQLINQLNAVMCRAELTYEVKEIQATLAWFNARWGEPT